MSITFGKRNTKEIYFGNRKVAKVYFGNQLIWPKATDDNGIVISIVSQEIIKFVPNEDITLNDFSIIVRDDGNGSFCYIFNEAGILLFYSGQNICSKQNIADDKALQEKFKLTSGYLLTFDVGSIKTNIILKKGTAYYFGGSLNQWDKPYIGNYKNKTGSNKSFDLNPGNIGQNTAYDLWDAAFLGESDYILPNDVALHVGDYFKYTGPNFGYYWFYNWQNGDLAQIVLDQSKLDMFKGSYTENPKSPENGYYMDCNTIWHQRVDGSQGTIGLFKYEDGTWTADGSQVLKSIAPIQIVAEATITNNKGYLRINGVEQ